MGAKGTATLDFGSTLKNDASVIVTGQAGILANSFVEAWIAPDNLTGLANGHSVDEHIMAAATLAITVPITSIVAGTGFTIQGVDSLVGQYGKFNIAWVWN